MTGNVPRLSRGRGRTGPPCLLLWGRDREGVNESPVCVRAVSCPPRLAGLIKKNDHSLVSSVSTRISRSPTLTHATHRALTREDVRSQSRRRLYRSHEVKPCQAPIAVPCTRTVGRLRATLHKRDSRSDLLVSSCVLKAGRAFIGHGRAEVQGEDQSK